MDVLQDFSTKANLSNSFVQNPMNFYQQQPSYPFQNSFNFGSQCLPYNYSNMQSHYASYYGLYCPREQPSTADLQQVSQNFKASFEQNFEHPQNSNSPSKKQWFNIIKDEPQKPCKKPILFITF